MSVILLRKAKIYDPRSRFHLKKMDVVIENGAISRIVKNVRRQNSWKVVESDELCISPGWLDIGCFNGEPGFEYREDLDSLCEAAMSGGYCSIAPFPTGEPTIDSKGQLSYLLSLAKGRTIDIFPIASLTKGRRGKEISELIDLHHGGAVAFSDGPGEHLDTRQLQRCLLYLKKFGGTAIYSACKKSSGQLHEGEVSVRMGMEGMPEHDEDSNIQDAISQCAYSEGRLLIHGISTTQGLKEGKKSAKEGRLFFSVPFMNLIFEDQDVLDFDLNLKTLPPLRRNKKELVKALNKGQIAAIVSNHMPLSKEEKDQPFGLSKFGASTIETVFCALNSFSKDLKLENLLYALSVGPHAAIGLECPTIDKNQKAYITVFDPSKSIVIEKTHLKSKSTNNPFMGKSMKGTIIGIINGSRSTI